MRLEQGSISINNREVYKGMDSGSFKRIFYMYIDSYISGNIEIYDFKTPQIIEGLSVWVRIIFKGSTLSSIEIKNSDINLRNAYDTWEDNKVELRRKSHNNWLHDNLGEAHQKSPVAIIYRYNWGKIESYWDFKSGDTGILITYIVGL